MHVSKSKKESALYLLTNSKALGPHITLATATVRTKTLVVLLLLCPLSLAFLTLHEKG
jgi:hypothetical protein